MFVYTSIFEETKILTHIFWLAIKFGHGSHGYHMTVDGLHDFVL